MTSTHFILFAANLTFIVTHLYGWLLKWFYRPKAYGEHFRELFPAQRIVGATYLLQIFELPYLLQIGDSDALIFVNAFSLLFLSIQLIVMSEIYFFPKQKHRRQYPLLYLPALIVLLPMFLQAMKIIPLPEGWRTWVIVAVSILFAFYFGLNIHMLWRIEKAVRRANEEQYADSDDFPVRFANIIKWMPTFVIILLAINFYADDPWMKFAHDIFFIFANVWFCILTLNPWRKVNSEFSIQHSELETQESELKEVEDDDNNDTEEDDDDDVTSELTERNSESIHLLSDAKYDELARRLEKLLSEDHIFTEPHITITALFNTVNNITLLKDAGNGYWLPEFSGTLPNSGFNARANGLFRSSAQRYEDLLTGAHFWLPESGTAAGTATSAVLQYYCSDGLFQESPKGDLKGVRCIRKVAP